MGLYIRRAKGYGKSWQFWALGFEALPFVPSQLPDCDYLDIAIAITKIDCDFACLQEFERRKKSFRYRMDLDQTEDFSRLTFRLMREPPPATLQEVPAEHSCQASLCRMHKGVKLLKIIDEDVPSFNLHSEATFGPAQITILSQSKEFITFELLHGTLPSCARLSQPFIAMSNSELFSQFHKFWSPYWLRDPHESQFDDRHCAAFFAELEDIPLPHFPTIDIDVGDVELWMKAIHDLKPGKAHGPCGWRHEELKCLPKVCVQKLAKIFSKLVNFSFHGFMMFARTILLPKNDAPGSMNQIRPITIISALFRLLGKVIFRTVADKWSTILPWNVSGGLPKRGVKELSFRQKLAIEHSLVQKKQLGGFSLDLVKAFNTFDRRILRYAMIRLGIPEHIVQFWFLSLSKLLRFPQVNGCLGPPIKSTTGVPEGDSLSVLAMISLSTLFFYKLQHVHVLVTPFCYADNWAWSAGSKHAHSRAFVAMLNLVAALRVSIDFCKSWFWALKKDFKQTCSDLHLLFPSGDVQIPVKSHVKDLGEVVSYNRRVPLDFIRSRIDQAITRIHRLRHIPSSIQCKLQKIQSACWPLALYAAETTYVGQNHFHDLRKAVVTAVVGKRKFANSWLAVFSLSKHICDPLLYVIYNIIRLVKRLHETDPSISQMFLELSDAFTGFRPFGPASCLVRYLQIVGWHMSSDGMIQCGSSKSVHLLHDSIPYIIQTFRAAWPETLLQFIDRKGIGEYIPHPSIGAKIFSSFSRDDQSLLAFFFLGSFQVESIKSIWKHDADPRCPLCGEVDTRPHRFLSCPSFQDIRDQFPDAVGILEGERPEWSYLPIPRASPQAELCHLLFHNFPKHDDPTPFSYEEVPSWVTFYTDGGAIHPQIPDARISSWAVVQDMSTGLSDRKAVADYAFGPSPKLPLFKTVAVGLTPGPQSAARAELYAILVAIKTALKIPSLPHVLFVTDASYVCSIIKKIVKLGPACLDSRMPHIDLIRQIADLWIPDRFVVKKVKSHQKFEHARSLEQLWDILGNSCVDLAATCSLKSMPSEIRDLSTSQYEWYVREKNWLLEVCRFVLAHNRKRINLLNQLPCQSNSDNVQNVDEVASNLLMPPKLFGCDAVEFLIHFNPISYIPLPRTGSEFLPELEILQLFQQGANMARALALWAALLKWPTDVHESYKRPDDWGISWVELFINFTLVTGLYFPVKVSGTGAQTVFAAYESDEALLAPKSRRSLAIQTLCFQRSLCSLNSFFGVQWFPKFLSNKCRSLTHLKWEVQAAGIPCRPVLPLQSETLSTIKKIAYSPAEKYKLCEPYIRPGIPQILEPANLPELDARVRCSKYSLFMKARRDRTQHGV